MEIDKIDLPPIDYDNEHNIAKRFNLNILNDSKQLITFEFRIFKYIFSSEKKSLMQFIIKSRHLIKLLLIIMLLV